MEYWRAKRRDALFAQLADMKLSELGTGRAEAFIYRTLPDSRDFSLVAAGSGLTRLLGSAKADDRLSASSNARNAVRLRRIFETVEHAGEPLLAEFHSTDGDDGDFVEVVATPLTTDGHSVAAIFGGVVVRPRGTARQHSVQIRRPDHAPVIFAIGSSAAVGERLCAHLGTRLADLEERSFEDGEQKIRPLVNVRDRDVYVVHGLAGGAGQTANDKLCRLLFFVGALKDAAAARVTAVVPYLCYGRKDRQTKARDPVTTRYVAQLFEAVGTDRVISMEVHNVAAFQNAFRCDTEHLDADLLFAGYFKGILGKAPVAVVSPDPGGVKRAERFRKRLETTLQRPVAAGFMEKHRSSGEVTGTIFAGDVSGRSVIIVDDLISTGGTMARMAVACRDRDADKVYLAATHGLLNKGAGDILRGAPIDRVALTDSVDLPVIESSKIEDRLQVVSVTGIFAEAVRRCHTGGSIVQLLNEGD